MPDDFELDENAIEAATRLHCRLNVARIGVVVVAIGILSLQLAMVADEARKKALKWLDRFASGQRLGRCMQQVFFFVLEIPRVKALCSYREMEREGGKAHAWWR